jgi:putative SOS response-associated peptidase YedK
MCGRYAFFDEQEVYEARKILEDIAASFGKEKTEAAKTGEIFPTENAALLCQGTSAPVARALRWGFLLPDSKLVINAKLEGLFDKPFFARHTTHRKCLIPANAFYEWEKRDGSKIRHTVGVCGQPFFYMCGLYASFTIDGQTAERFVIITQPANEQMQFIHPRMPLILPAKFKDEWLHETKDTRLLAEKIAKCETLLDIA